MRCSAAAVCVVLSLFAAACGGEEEPDPEDDVRATLTTWADAVQAKDGRRVCEDVFAPELVARVEQLGPCADTIGRSLEDLQGPQLSVDAVAVDGDRATAQVRTSALGQDGSSDTVELVLVAGDWRVSELSTEPPAAG